MKFPEQYRFKTTDCRNEKMRVYASNPGDPFGYFHIPPDKARGRALKCLACSANDAVPWEHVSVSLHGWETKTPSWEEMCIVKSLFWDDEDWVVQYHPAKSSAVNMHPGCLHLWRMVSGIFPMPTPPKELV